MKMKVDENKNQKLPRKLRKIIVEKKRRERIDNALKQIKDMLFGTSELQNDYMKMEKADILENVVKYLQTQPTPGTSTPTSTQAISEHLRYSQGYAQCVREVNRLMGHLCGTSSQITQSLTHYLNAKVISLQTQAQLSERLCVNVTPQHPQRSTEDYARLSMPPLQSLHTESKSTHGADSTSTAHTRVPPFHTSPNSAFHRVSATSQQRRGTDTRPTSADNISIAVYQYNHYNNYKNGPHTGVHGSTSAPPVTKSASATSHINIHPSSSDNPSDTSANESKEDLDVSDVSMNAQSHISIHPYIKLESQQPGMSSDVSFEEHDSKIDLNCDNMNKLPPGDGSMWRPW